MVDEEHTESSITRKGYDLLAEQADILPVSPWKNSDYQAYYVWPAVRPLLPDITGKQVLDAGCGIGDYTGWFLENGASVVGVDVSEKSVSTARDRFGDRATFYCTDLTGPFDFATGDTFDLVFSNLVLDHIENWRSIFDEFHRVLTTDGVVVFTTIHPMRRYRRHRDELTTYYETEACVGYWGNTEAQIVSYHRPISEIITSLTDTGFTIDEFREATPQDTYEEYNPERYETAMKMADTLCVRAQSATVD